MERPVVAFCDIEKEIHAKAKKQVADLTAEDLSEGEEEDQSEDVNPMDKDEEFSLDDDVDLGLPVLDQMLSNRQPAPNQENVAPSATTVLHMEMRNRLPTEYKWEHV